MTNTGNDNTAQTELEKPKISRFTRIMRSPISLLLMGVLLIGSAVIGFQAFGILYSIVFPPKPPIPENVTEMRHTNIDYGVDDWVYGTEQDACQIVRFYRIQGAECQIIANICGGNNFEFTMQTAGQHVATCIGTQDFSIFAMRWEANISTGYNNLNTPTQFSLTREVFWTGDVPPALNPKTGFDLDG